MKQESPFLRSVDCTCGRFGWRTNIAELIPDAESLLLAFSPGPITVVLNKKPNVPDLVTSGHPTVAVRIPAHL